MENEKAQKIIADLFSNTNLYKNMAKKENEVWGKTFSNSGREEALKKDQEAAKKLRINRDILNLSTLIKKHKLSPKVGLSLACGSGRAEGRLLLNGICQEFHGIDISSEALAQARKQAAAQGLNITYEQSDLNSVPLQEGKYDLVVAQTCLHHILRLEYLAEEIYKSMTPRGVLWIHDFIGETQFQYSDDRLEIVNFILSILPERMCYDSVNERIVKKLFRREPGTLVSPFEAIRSAEIMPVFLEYFDILEKKEFDSILRFVCPVGTRAAYLENEESQALFEILFFLDRLLVEKNILSPCGGTYLLKKKVTD